MEIRKLISIGCLIVIATFCTVLNQGNNVGKIDHSLQIPYIKVLNNPQLYQNDLMVETMKRYYFVYLWRVIALISNYFPIEILLNLTNFITRFLFYSSLLTLAWILFKKKEVLILTLFLFLYPLPSLGGRMMQGQFVHSTFVIPILIFSFCFFLKDKIIPALFLLVLSFYIHPIYAGYVTVGYLLFFLSSRKRIISKNFLVFLLFLGLSLPVLLGGGNIGKAVGFDSHWIQISRIRSSYHLFPFSWSAITWFQILILFILWLFSLRFKPIKSYHQKVMFFVYAIFIFMVIGIVFSEFIPIASILLLIPFRSTEFFSYFAGIYIANFIYCVIIKKIPQKIVKPLFLIIVIFTVVVTGIGFYRFTHEDAYFLAWKEAQIWAKNNTRINTVFITPPYIDGFRVFSERGIVGDWKDGTGAFWSSPFTLNWWQRMNDFGINEKHYDEIYQIESYNNLTKTQFLQIAEKYNANYIVTEKDKKMDLPLLFQNSYFNIYFIKK